VVDIDTHCCRTDHDQMFRELNSTIETRKKAVDFFWDEIDWDLFEVVKTGTDRLQHYLFDAVEDEKHPRYLQALAYYKKIEDFIKYCWELCYKGQSADQEGNGFYMLSDHGFCLIKKEVYLNAWLRQNGYLEFEQEPPAEISDLKKTSKAFALDPSRIYLNRVGKFPKGFLTTAQAEELRKEIKEKLLTLEYEGEKVLQAVYFPEEIYTGPETRNAPDIICVSKHGFDLKGNIRKTEIFGNSDLTGMHTFDDAFFWAKECKQEKLNITQLAQIFMEKLG
jgi:predicted AlkP superfamily phosphohydrolase/phosphomutase